MATLAPPRPKNYDDSFFKPISLWLTTTDHKLIGIMYMTTGLLSFVIGGVFALVMRIQLSQPNLKVIDANTYNELVYHLYHAINFALLRESLRSAGQT